MQENRIPIKIPAADVQKVNDAVKINTLMLNRLSTNN